MEGYGPEQGITVWLYQGDISPQFVRFQVTARDGSFRFDNLAPGTYTLTARYDLEGAWYYASEVTSVVAGRGTYVLLTLHYQGQLSQ